LALVVGLTGVTSQWIRAERYAAGQSEERKNAEQQRDIANENLYGSLVREARALRLARESGYRPQVWDRLKQALALDTPAKNIEELRQEAVACMGDFVGLEPTVLGDFPSPITKIAVRPQVPQLAIGLEDGTLVLHDLTSAKEIPNLPGHESTIVALSFNLTGKMLASGDGHGNVRVWEASALDRWTLRMEFAVPGAGIDTLAITANEERLLVCHDSGAKVTSYSLTDETAGTQVHELPDPNAWVRGTAFTPDGRLLARGQKLDGVSEVLVWDVAKRQILTTLTPMGWTDGMTFSRDGRLIVCACSEGAEVFDTTNNRRVTFVKGAVNSVAVSPDKQVLATGNQWVGLTRAWSISTNREVAVLRHPPHGIRQVVFSHDSRLLVRPTPRDIRVWNLAGTSEKLVTSGYAGAVPGVTFNPDGTLLASAGKDKTVKIWNPVTGDIVRELSGFSGEVQTVAFSPDGQMLATGDWAGAVQIWDTDSWEQLGDNVDHGLGPRIWFVTFSPNGDYFAVGSTRGPGGTGPGAKVWQLQPQAEKGNSGSRLSLKELAQLTTQNVTTLRFSPDSKLLAWYERPWGAMNAHVWELERGKELFVSPSRPAPATHNIAFYDSKHLIFVSTDHVIEAWNVYTGQQAFSFGAAEYPHAPTVLIGGGYAALSKDGRWFAAESGQTVTVWDTQSKKLLLTLPEEPGMVWSLAWSPDGKRLAVGTSVGGPVIWNISKIREQLAELGLDWE
jgi:WD40 repeat protein